MATAIKHRFSAPIHDLESARERWERSAAQKTLGSFFGELLGCYFAADILHPKVASALLQE